jgi:hypothetical protein
MRIIIYSKQSAGVCGTRLFFFFFKSSNHIRHASFLDIIINTAVIFIIIICGLFIIMIDKIFIIIN